MNGVRSDARSVKTRGHTDGRTGVWRASEGVRSTRMFRTLQLCLVRLQPWQRSSVRRLLLVVCVSSAPISSGWNRSNERASIHLGRKWRRLVLTWCEQRTRPSRSRSGATCLASSSWHGTGATRGHDDDYFSAVGMRGAYKGREVDCFDRGFRSHAGVFQQESSYSNRTLDCVRASSALSTRSTPGLLLPGFETLFWQ